jgi:hypothetical protein
MVLLTDASSSVVPQYVTPPALSVGVQYVTPPLPLDVVVKLYPHHGPRNELDAVLMPILVLIWIWILINFLTILAYTSYLYFSLF